MITMKAVKSFRGQPHEGKIKLGMEFNTHEARAQELELHGLAYPVTPVPQTKMDSAPLNKMEPKLQNKAAAAGPLDSPGGRTGAEKSPSSSPAAPAPKTRRSPTSKATLDL